MDRTDSAFAGVYAKLRRSRRHLDELRVAVRAFESAGPRGLLVGATPDEEDAFKNVHAARSVPVELSVMAGEVVAQLRSALDHAVCVLVTGGGGTVTRRTMFPIFMDEPKGAKDRRRYEECFLGIDPHTDAAAVIEQAQPYLWAAANRDNHALAILRRLNNEDKHRALSLHVLRVDSSCLVTIRNDDGDDDVLSFDAGAPERHLQQGDTLLGGRVVRVQPCVSGELAFAETSGRIHRPLVLMRLQYLTAYVNRLTVKLAAEL